MRERRWSVFMWVRMRWRMVSEEVVEEEGGKGSVVDMVSGGWAGW